MSTVYIVRDGYRTAPMDRVRLQNEDLELQRLLEENRDLLPGNQIRPDDPCRWLTIRREMPVISPSSGTNRWSIDFLLVDQSAVPTFVECKRFDDTRARREVIGQMLEYAANGHHYWSRDLLVKYAEESATKCGQDLTRSVADLLPDTGESLESFFDQLEANLRSGQVRLVFFMEEAPHELKSIVEFLNRQMERSEVLIVEARRYRREGIEVVVPTLFGYTEEARMVKRPTAVSVSSKRSWTEEGFFKQLSEMTDTEVQQAIRAIYTTAQQNGYELRFGSGGTGSFSLVPPEVTSKSLISVYANGTLSLNFGWLTGNDSLEALREEVARVGRDAGLEFPEDYTGLRPGFAAPKWIGSVGAITDGISRIAQNYVSGGPENR